MIDGEDYTAIRWDMIKRFGPSTYFKYSVVPDHLVLDVYAEHRADVEKTVRIVPFPLATTAPIEPRPKDIDVSFLGGTSWFLDRKEGVVPSTGPAKPLLEARLSREFSNFLGGYRPYDEYREVLARSRVAVCPGGHGIGSIRTLETAAAPGTLLGQERVSHITPWPFLDGANCFLWSATGTDPFEELVGKIRHYLDHEEERARIAAAGNAHVAQNDTPRSRARQLLEEAMRVVPTPQAPAPPRLPHNPHPLLRGFW